MQSQILPPAMAEQRYTNLEAILAPWPIANNISRHLGAGDLISLSRTSISIRASLHGFSNYIQPWTSSSDVESNASKPAPREYLNIGLHDTLYWRRLKESAAFVCSSTAHVRGDVVHPCRYCASPICETCIVKDAMNRGKGKENTFASRCRSFCEACWDGGNLSKSRRFPLVPTEDNGGDQLCTCTNKKDSWLCMKCKLLQNANAVGEGAKFCHGEGCTNLAGPHADRRRICMWCEKSLPSHLGSSFRIEWNLKIIEARRRSALSRQADMEEYNKKRLRLMRMSRRELRGDAIVEHDAQADAPQYVRHLDTFNYRRYMPQEAAPTGNEVYLSKKGHWTYARNFLKHFARFCSDLPLRDDVAVATSTKELEFSRTNLERRRERHQYSSVRKKWYKRFRTAIETTTLERWYNLKPTIQRLFIIERLPLGNVQFIMFRDEDFSATEEQYQFMMVQWGSGWLDLNNPTLSFETAKEPNIDNTENDLQIARRLQEEMDREAAQALQHVIWDTIPDPVRGFGQDNAERDDQETDDSGSDKSTSVRKEVQTLPNAEAMEVNPLLEHKGKNKRSDTEDLDSAEGSELDTVQHQDALNLHPPESSSSQSLQPTTTQDSLPSNLDSPAAQPNTVIPPIDNPPSYEAAFNHSTFIDSDSDDVGDQHAAQPGI
jgi:hypothetical protein